MMEFLLHLKKKERVKNIHILGHIIDIFTYLYYLNDSY